MFDSRRSNHKDKVIITAALTGAVTTKNDNPALPTQPDEIVESAFKCYEAGAATVHIHVRNEDDSASMRFDRFEEIVTKLRDRKFPGLINLTSSGGQGFSWDERIKPFKELKPEMASFDAGTMNWLNTVVFMNEPGFLEHLGAGWQGGGLREGPSVRGGIHPGLGNAGTGHFSRQGGRNRQNQPGYIDVSGQKERMKRGIA